MSEFRQEDEDGGVFTGAKQKTIDSFLSSKSSPTKKTFSCPICSRDVAVPSEYAFNAHLDSCLGENEEVRERQQEQPSEAVTVSVNKDSSNEEIVFDGKGQGESSKVTDCTAKSEDPKPTSPPDLSDEEVRCPGARFTNV
jgi:hypothetical protein